jgi:hypothetical protein
LHNTSNKKKPREFEHAKLKQKNTNICTNQIMKQLNTGFKNMSKHKKQNDAKNGKRKVRKFAMQKQQQCMRNVGTIAM